MRTIGQLLIEKGWITADQLAVALERQKEFGGRLGTALLELGAVSEERLVQALSLQHNAPPAWADDLADIASEVAALMTAQQATRYRAVPFAVVDGVVYVAMATLEKLDDQDELSFILGRNLRIHVGAECRVLEALGRCYGADVPIRFRMLLERLAVGAAIPEPSATAASIRATRSTGTPTAGRATPRELDRRPRVPPLKPVTQKSIPLSANEREALETARGQGAQTAPEHSAEAGSRPLSAAGGLQAGGGPLELEEALERATTPDDVGRILLELLSHELVRALLFRVHRRQVHGWLGFAPALDSERLTALTTTLEAPSVFREVSESGVPFVGPLTEQAVHRQIAAACGGTLGTECLVIPITVDGRLVWIAYGDRDALGLQGVDFEAVQRQASGAGRALEMCIVRRKRASAAAAPRERARR